MLRDRELWTWHLIAGVVILALLGLHMAVMHLDALLGIFNPADGHPVDWPNVAARSRSLFFAVTYVILLGTALFHGLYGLRNILFETSPARRLQRSLNWALVIVGLGLFALGTWAAWASYLNTGLA